MNEETFKDSCNVFTSEKANYLLLLNDNNIKFLSTSIHFCKYVFLVICSIKIIVPSLYQNDNFYLLILHNFPIPTTTFRV